MMLFFYASYSSFIQISFRLVLAFIFLIAVRVVSSDHLSFKKLSANECGFSYYKNSRNNFDVPFFLPSFLSLIIFFIGFFLAYNIYSLIYLHLISFSLKLFLFYAWLFISLIALFFFNIFFYLRICKNFFKKCLKSVLLIFGTTKIFSFSHANEQELLQIAVFDPIIPCEATASEDAVEIATNLGSSASQAGELNLDGVEKLGKPPLFTSGFAEKSFDFPTIGNDLIAFMYRGPVRANYHSTIRIPVRQREEFLFQGLPPESFPINQEGASLTLRGFRHFFDYIGVLRTKHFGSLGNRVTEDYMGFIQKYLLEIGEVNLNFFRITAQTILHSFNKIITLLKQLSSIVLHKVDSHWLIHIRNPGVPSLRQEVVAYLAELYNGRSAEDVLHFGSFEDLVSKILENCKFGDLHIIDQLIPCLTSMPVISFFAISMVFQSLFGLSHFMRLQPFIALDLQKSLIAVKNSLQISNVIIPPLSIPAVIPAETPVEVTLTKGRFIAFLKEGASEILVHAAYKAVRLYFPTFAHFSQPSPSVKIEITNVQKLKNDPTIEISSNPSVEVETKVETPAETGVNTAYDFVVDFLSSFFSKQKNGNMGGGNPIHRSGRM